MLNAWLLCIKALRLSLLLSQWSVSGPLVLVCVLVHLHFNLVSSVLVPFQIGSSGEKYSGIELVDKMTSQLEDMKRPNVKTSEIYYQMFGLLTMS